MKKIVIEGGRRLKGRVDASGSKNSALPVLLATLLTDEPCRISNVPWLEDIRTTIGILEYCGKKVDRKGDALIVRYRRPAKTRAPYDLVKRMRASVLVAGPLLARYNKVDFSLPGGCAIGTRPINIHLDGFRELGAAITMAGGHVKARTKRLRGREILLDFPSVGATENIVMAAVLAEGKTVLDNAAMEPEIEDLCRFLNAMGARIKGIGSKRLTIHGVATLHGAEHRVIPDRIEAATYLAAGAVTKGDVTVSSMEPLHVEAMLVKLKQSGFKVVVGPESVRVIFQGKIKPIDAKTAPYPGLATDLQPLWMGIMSLAQGRSVVEETVFENRFMHVGELTRMGANIRVTGNTAVVEGVKELSAAPVMCSDLRAGAALVLAALAAKGKTEITRVYHLDRGYENLEKKLTKLGAKVRRVEA